MQRARTKGVCLQCSSSSASPSACRRVVQRQGRGVFPASVQEGHLLATVLSEAAFARAGFC